MPELILPARFNQQPQFAAPLDRSISFNDGALVAVNYAVSSYNFAAQAPPNLQIGVGGVFGVGPLGRYKAMYTGGASTVDDRYAFPSTIDFAFLAVVDYSGSPGVVSSIIGGDGSGDRAFQFRFNGSNQLEFIRFDTGGTPYFATVAATSRKGVVLGVSVGNTFSVYFGASSGTGTIANTPQPASRLSTGGSFGFDGAASNGDVMYALAALRGSSVRSAASAYKLMANPWQIYQPPPRRLWAKPSAVSPALVATTTSYALTLNSIALRTGRRLVASPATYALSAKNVGLLRYRRITATTTSYALTLVSARLARGLRLSVTPITYAVTAQSIALRTARVLVASPATYALTGQTIGMSTGGKTINALPASYVVTTQAANLAAARRLVASPATYALTLQSIALRAARRLAITAATYSFTAQAVNLVKAAPGQLTALTASYALTVQAIAVRAARRLAATPAAYTLTPTAVTMTRAGRALQALATAYSFTVNALVLRASRAMSALTAAYSLTVNAANLVAGRRLAASPTSYALTARSIGMAKGRFITATPAAYTLTLRTAGMYARRHLAVTTTGYSFTGWPVLMFTGARPLRTIHHSLRLPPEDRILELPAEDRILKAPPCLQ